MNFVKSFTAAALFALSITTAAAEPLATPLEVKRLQFYALHLKCNAALEANTLNRADIRRCELVYAALKLSFLENVPARAYLNATNAERAQFNLKAYLAYRDWVETTQPQNRIPYLASLKPMADT